MGKFFRNGSKMCENDGMPGAASKTPGPFVKEVAAVLREKVAREGLSHQQLAEVLDVSRGQLSKILAGNKQIELEQLDEICWALGLNFRDVVVNADKATSFRHTSDEWTTETAVRR